MPCSAVPWRALVCPGVPCRAVLYCCAMMCGVARCCVVLCRGEVVSYQMSLLGLAWRIIINSAPLSRAHHSASSPAQRRAVPRGAVPCRALPCPARALPCGAVQCCAMLPAFCCLFIHACQVSFEVSYHRYYCCTYHVRCVESQEKCSHSSAQPSYSSAAPCGAVPCCAVLSFEDTAVPGIMRYPVPTGMYVRVYSSFVRVLQLIVLSRSSFFFSKITPILAIRM